MSCAPLPQIEASMKVSARPAFPYCSSLLQLTDSSSLRSSSVQIYPAAPDKIVIGLPWWALHKAPWLCTCCWLSCADAVTPCRRYAYDFLCEERTAKDAPAGCNAIGDYEGHFSYMGLHNPQFRPRPNDPTATGSVDFGADSWGIVGVLERSKSWQRAARLSIRT